MIRQFIVKGRDVPGGGRAFFDKSMTVGFCRYDMCFMAALVFQKPPRKKRRVKVSALRRLFFFCRRAADEFYIKERADNSSSKVLLVIGSASVRLAL